MMLGQARRAAEGREMSDEPASLPRASCRPMPTAASTPTRTPRSMPGSRRIPTRRSASQTYRRFGEELRALYDPVLEEAVPGRLMRSAGATRPWLPVAKAAAWLVVGLAIGVLAGWQLHEWRTPSAGGRGSRPPSWRGAPPWRTRPIPRRCRHPVEVGADQEQHLVTWLSKRLGTKVRGAAPRRGGHVARRRAPAARRERPGRAVHVSDAGRPPHHALRRAPKRAVIARPRSATRGRTTSASSTGSTATCGYALASADLAKEELLRVATLIYKQLD